MNSYLKGILLTVACISSSQTLAGLIGLEGDEIDAAIIRTIDDPIYGSGRICCYGLDSPFTVVEGVSDQKQYSSSFLLDVNNLSFQLDYIGFGSWQDGIILRLSDLDFGSGSLFLSGLNISTNVSGLTWSLGSNFIDLNIGGTSQDPGLYITGNFIVASVSEPAIASLFFLCVPALFLSKRRRKI